MKRFYATVALLGSLVTGAFAQREVDLGGITLAPLGESAAYDLNCNTDSVTETFLIYNNGPDDVIATDTVLYSDPRTTDDGYFYFFTGQTIAKDDTLVVINRKVSVKNGLKWLMKIEDDNTLSPVLRSALVSGTEYVWTNLIQFSGYAAENANATETVVDNNSGQSLVKWNCTVGINDVKYAKTALNVFPNPANNTISFTNEFAATTVATVKVTDLTGRVVKTMDLGKQNAGAKTYSVDITDLNNGMYYIELVTDNARSISKFTKN